VSLFPTVHGSPAHRSGQTHLGAQADEIEEGRQARAHVPEADPSPGSSGHDLPLCDGVDDGEIGLTGTTNGPARHLGAALAHEHDPTPRFDASHIKMDERSGVNSAVVVPLRSP